MLAEATREHGGECLRFVILGLLLFGLIVLMVAGFALLIVPGIFVLMLIIYWSVDVQAAVIEGNQANRLAEAQLRVGARQLVANIRRLVAHNASGIRLVACS